MLFPSSRAVLASLSGRGRSSASTASVVKSSRNSQSILTRRLAFRTATNLTWTQKATPAPTPQRPRRTTLFTPNTSDVFLSRRSFSTAPVDQSVSTFPSLLIGAESLTPQGSFAVAQATYLQPDAEAVQDLVDLLERTQTGIVAHYYMDVELQGVLQAAGARLPGRVGIADSLKMGDMAVDMAANHNCTAIACLGVDFMSESVQAILQQNGHGHIPVLRATHKPIGCSLAESAERESYRVWLEQESVGQAALHVVYINTSLETKAVSQSIVPTITCTSSNVLQTLLQASAQMGPELKILYGPDTYMGENLVTLLSTIEARWNDEQIASLHASHSRDTIRALRDSITVFPSGNCVVHHMFGASVVDLVRSSYDDCFVTAHLEVPGEMFEIAMERSLDDRGVVGSTSDILNFIARKVREAVNADTTPATLKFILGTEAGMVTSIVSSVQQILKQTGNDKIRAEIIFPVAQEAVAASENSALGIVPGVAGGEGCSTAGGCATCPFMKMNDLDALTDVLELVERHGGATAEEMVPYLPPARLQGQILNGVPATELGTQAIGFMREYMQTKQIPTSLCQKVMRSAHTRELLYRS